MEIKSTIKVCPRFKKKSVKLLDISELKAETVKVKELYFCPDCYATFNEKDELIELVKKL